VPIGAPSSRSRGLTREPLGRGVTCGAFKIDANPVKLWSGQAVEFGVARLTFAPGATTGWQLPAGPVIVIVTSGTLTKYDACDSTAQTLRAGQAFVLGGPGDQNLLRNEATVPAETLVTCISRARTDRATASARPSGSIDAQRT
jgi:quercetin dioxygenase-like cupin family protein